MYSKYIYKGGGPKDHRISFLISGVPPAYKEEIPGLQPSYYILILYYRQVNRRAMILVLSIPLWPLATRHKGGKEWREDHR
jgi:hypothetical protein